jgi:hypothetical protein
MPFTSNPLLAAYLKAFARSVLVSLGLDHVLIDFLENAAVGTVSVLVVIFFVALPIPHRQSANSGLLNSAAATRNRKFNRL